MLKADGDVACWGSYGAEDPPEGSGPFTSVSVAAARSCGVLQDQSILCWGDSGPEPVAGAFLAVSVGDGFGCALEADQDVACWGTNDVGQAPAHIAGPFASLDAGDAHACAIEEADSAIVCWGANGSGQAPAEVSGSFRSVSTGPSSTCAVRNSGDLVCWGDNSEGQAPPSVTGPFTDVSTARNRTCAVRGNGSVACWGSTFEGGASPEVVTGAFDSVSASASHVCAVRTDDLLSCWGDQGLLPTAPSDPDPDPFVQATEGSPYRHTFSVWSTSAVTFAVRGTLPAGLTLTSEEWGEFVEGPIAVLSGTIRKRGIYRFTLVATNLFGELTVPVTLRVVPPPGFDVNADGIPDLPVGAPGEDLGTTVDAGTVTVLLGSADGSYGRTGAVAISQETVGQRSERGDRFGAAITTGEITGDDHVDLIIGAPGEDGGAGQVMVVQGSPTGLAGSRRTVLRQGLAGAAGATEAGDGFGTAISVGNGLWVGAPGEDLGTARDAGVVTRFPVPLKTAGSVQYQQGARSVPGAPETGDRFGAALAGGGALIGAPGEDVGRIVDAGAVTWQLRHAVTQDSRSMPGSAERGDQFGAAVAASATVWSPDSEAGDWVPLTAFGIGAPGEDVGSRADAGMITLITDDEMLGYPDEEFEGITQDTESPGQRAEAGDRFGAALAISAEGSRLIVGAPGEDVSTVKDAGTVTVLPLYPGCSDTCSVGAEGGPTLDQAGAGVPGSVRTGSQFGAILAERPGTAGGYVVGVPAASVAGRAGAGTVIVMPDRGAAQELHQDSPGVPGGAENGDRFGTLAGR